MPILAHWKNHIDDLRSMALAVDVSPQDGCLSARGAARCLLGAVRMLADRFGRDAMQHACAQLARHAPAWTTDLRSLPMASDGHAAEPLWLMAAMSRGVLEVAGANATRAALAFWASADPVAAWERVRQITAQAA
jgi:hypothetical protein